MLEEESEEIEIEGDGVKSVMYSFCFGKKRLLTWVKMRANMSINQLEMETIIGAPGR